MRINGHVGVVLLALLPAFVWTAAHGQSFKELLKEELEKAAEEKAKEYGLDVPGSTEPERVSLTFAGATVPPPDVFEPITPPTGGSTGGGNAAAEQACYNAVQGKIAWDANGVNKTWSPANVQNLCRGTTKAAEPGTCFRTAMYNGSAWGQTSAHTMTWSKASKLCAGTNNSSQTITCFRGQISGGKNLDAAINACDKDPGTSGDITRLVYVPSYQLNTALKTSPSPSTTSPSTTSPSTKPVTATPLPIGTTFKPQVLSTANAEAGCYDNVQGRIPWDPQGQNRNWSPNNVKRLCKGTTSKYEPGKCFQWAMFSGTEWGRKSTHTMNWQSAVDLCEGTSNAAATQDCFKNAIRAGRTVAQAAQQCDK